MEEIQSVVTLQSTRLRYCSQSSFVSRHLLSKEEASVFWSWLYSGAVSMFLFAVLALLLPVLFIYRFYVVVKTGLRHQPGRKGSVSVLVVAGSGN